MNVMNCDQFENQLERWMEGERGGDAEAHLRSCPRCSSLVEDLDSIHSAARSIGAVEEIPSERLWLSIRAQLEHEGLIHETVPQERGSWAVSNWFAEIFSAVPRPALAGAYLVALIAIGIAVAHPNYRPANSAWDQDSTGTLSAHLDTAEHDTFTLRDSEPDVAATLHKNLAIVDNYIALCEKSVQQDPDSEIARDYLYDAYRQKADLLAQMTERGDGE